jgi:hypothetical protein
MYLKSVVEDTFLVKKTNALMSVMLPRTRNLVPIKK